MPEAHNINDINLLKEVVFDSKQLDSYRSEDSNEINLMTLHKSKGLEFDAVIHADLYEWGLPSKRWKIIILRNLYIQTGNRI